MRIPFWSHVVITFVLMALGVVLFSFPIIFRLIYPVVVPAIQNHGIPSWFALLLGLVSSVAVLAVGMLPAKIYLAKSRILCTQIGCPGKAELIATRPVMTYKCPLCGSPQKTWFGLGTR